MPTHYDKRGNIPGPGGSRIQPIPRWQSEDDQAILEHENRWGKEIEDISKDVIVTAASQGRFGSTPASEQTVDVAAMEVMDLHPNIYRQAVVYHRNNPDAGWGAAIKAAKLSAGSSPETLRRRFMKSPKDRYPDAGGIKGMSQEPKVSTNEHIKRALLNDQNIVLSPTYKGGQITRRDHADFFDVSAALIGGGQEDARDPSGRKIDYNRAKVTEFGGTKSEKRDMVYNHINSKIKGGISREEFNEYAREQIAAEKDLRKAIKLLNVRAYASMKGIDLSEYPTKESQLELLSEINKAKKNKTGHLDYKETFDYGHIISAKTGFRVEDLGMNRISNTEIEAAHNIVSRDPYTQKIIEILQEGNRERGSRRDYHPTIQRMRNTAGSVVEDFIKWKASKDGDGVDLTRILDKFIPRDQHDNYLQFIQKKFYEKRSLGYATKKEFVEEVYGFPYKLYKDMPNKQKVEINKAYQKQRSESGIVAGKQQYDQAGEWMLEAIDEFIGLHHFSKPKQLQNTKESTQLQDIHDFHTDTGAPLTIEDLLDMILPD